MIVVRRSKTNSNPASWLKGHCADSGSREPKQKPRVAGTTGARHSVERNTMHNDRRPLVILGPGGDFTREIQGCEVLSTREADRIHRIEEAMRQDRARLARARRANLATETGIKLPGEWGGA